MQLNEMTKEEVADVAASLLSYQLLGPTTLLEYADKYPWLVERAPEPAQMTALLELAQRGKTIAEADRAYYRRYLELAYPGRIERVEGVECPRCQAQPGETCREPLTGVFHPQRTEVPKV